MDGDGDAMGHEDKSVHFDFLLKQSVLQEPTATQDLCSQTPTAGMPCVQEIGDGASRNLKTIDGCTSTLHQIEIRSLSRKGVGRFMGSGPTARIFRLVRLARTQVSPSKKLHDVMKKVRSGDRR